MTKNKRVIRAKRNTIKFPYYQDCWTNASLPFTNYCSLTTNNTTMKILQLWCSLLKDDEGWPVQTTRAVLSKPPGRRHLQKAALDHASACGPRFSEASPLGWKVEQGWHPLAWFKEKERLRGLPSWAAMCGIPQALGKQNGYEPLLWTHVTTACRSLRFLCNSNSLQGF